MTVKELREFLEGLKDDKEIIVECNGKYLDIAKIRNSHVTNEIILETK